MFKYLDRDQEDQEDQEAVGEREKKNLVAAINPDVFQP